MSWSRISAMMAAFHEENSWSTRCQRIYNAQAHSFFGCLHYELSPNIWRHKALCFRGTWTKNIILVANKIIPTPLHPSTPAPSLRLLIERRQQLGCALKVRARTSRSLHSLVTSRPSNAASFWDSVRFHPKKRPTFSVWLKKIIYI